MLLQKISMRHRSGFTLVELLVAAAVSIMLMVILTQAFAAGLEMFRKLRAQGNLQERLRMASISMRDDLTRPHYSFNPGDQNLTDDDLSSRNLHQAYPNGNPFAAGGGFFRIWEGAMSDLAGNPIVEPGPGGQPLPFALEGTDSEGLLFGRATTHLMHFTVRRRGTGLDELFRCRDFIRTYPNPPSPPNPLRVFPRDYVYPTDYREDISPTESYFTTRLAEVSYFLVPTGEFTTGQLVPRFTLHRRIKLLVPPAGSGIPGNNLPVAVPPPSAEISTRTVISAPPAPGQYYNRPADVQQPRFRSAMQPAPNVPSKFGPYTPMLAGLMQTAPTNFWAANRYPALAEELVGGVGNADAGNDVLLHDVISFEVKAWWDAPNQSVALTAAEVASLQPRLAYNYPGIGVIPNTDYPFDYIPFSTKNAYFANNPLNVPRARVFDTWSNAGPYGTLPPAVGPPSPPAPPPPVGMFQPEWRRWDAVPPTNTPCRLPVPIRIKALQIRIRVWDQKSEQTRQITIVQDM